MTDQSLNKTISFIGAGRIGRRLIRALLAASFRVNVYDKHKSAAKHVLALGAIWAATPRDAVDDARAVITCLAQPEHDWNCMMDATGVGVTKRLMFRKIGYSVDDEERTLGMRCVAAPIYNVYGEAVAAISISGPCVRMPKSAIKKIGSKVQEGADLITQNIGGNRPQN